MPLSAPRPVVEAALKLDLAEPAVRRVVSQRFGRGRMSWSADWGNAATIEYQWTGAALELRFTVRGVACWQRIAIVRTRPRFGGVRLWFACPRLGVPVRALLLPPGATVWASRRALGACYASQHESRVSGFLRLARLAVRTDQRERAHDRRNAIRRLRRAERKLEALAQGAAS